MEIPMTKPEAVQGGGMSECRKCGQRIRERNGVWVCEQSPDQLISGGSSDCPRGYDHVPKLSIERRNAKVARFTGFDEIEATQ